MEFRGSPHDGAGWFLKVAKCGRELTIQDFRSYLVLTINDEVQVDVSRQAWKVNYAEALPGVETRTIEGVRIPYLGLQSLIESKSTYRA